MTKQDSVFAFLRLMGGLLPTARGDRPFRGGHLRSRAAKSKTDGSGTGSVGFWLNHACVSEKSGGADVGHANCSHGFHWAALCESCWQSGTGDNRA